MLSEKKIKELEERIIYLDKLLLNKRPNHEKINSLLYQIRQEILRYEIKINQSEVNNQILDDKTTYLKKRLEIIVKNVDLVDNHNSKILQHNQKKSIETLTVINTIFLPLALITGYFGMNFKSMGCPTTSNGILTIKNGQALVFTLFFMVSAITILLFKYNIV